MEREARSGLGFLAGGIEKIPIPWIEDRPIRKTAFLLWKELILTLQLHFLRYFSGVYLAVYLLCICLRAKNTVYFVYLKSDFVNLPSRVSIFYIRERSRPLRLADPYDVRGIFGRWCGDLLRYAVRV